MIYSDLQIEGLVHSLRSMSFERAVEHMAELMTQGPVPRLLLKPEEAAHSFGFTFSAFRQADWSKEIPVRKVGNLNRYRPDDLKTVADNFPVVYLRSELRQ